MIPRFKPWLLAVSIVALLSASAQGQGQYKRVHQNALTGILSGDLKKTITRLQQFAEKYPHDAETQFMLALAQANANQADAAVAAMRKAIELELPAGRFLAGPRELLPNLRKRSEFASVAEAAGPIIHGPMLGNVTATSVDIWVRLADEGTVTASIAGVPAQAQVTPGKATKASDYTAVVQVTGLQTNTEYKYELEVDGKSWSGSQQSFSTPSATGKPGTFSFVFGGGAGFVPPNERAWTTIEQQDPDLLLLLGDNVYSDDPKTPDMQRYCYYRRQSRPEFRRLVSRTPVYTIWDDHDFGTNDCWGGPQIDQPKWKRPVWEVYRQNWVNPGYGGGTDQPGCWYDFSRGDVDFIMLDGRYYRTNPKVDNPSMLGPVQLAWLKDTLSKSRGTLKFLCSPVPWDYRTKGDSRDTWNGFKREREEIFSFLAENQIEGVVLLSADRHRSDAWRIERPDAYALYEFNSSRLTNQHVHGEMKQAIFSYNKKQSFGRVEVDTTVDDPTVTYQVISIDGKVVHELTIRRSQLK